jgi:diadenosine tetraphosphate (Ap4A) HIT family hydrolase
MDGAEGKRGEAAMNATILKFGYPNSLVKDYRHWVVLARPAQLTLGSLVLAAKSDATAYGALSPEAFAEQGLAIADIEHALTAFTSFERINYLMLMMVDPHVHFHVFPRYSAPRSWNGRDFADSGWPGPPQLGAATALEGKEIAQLAGDLAVIFR